MYGSNSAVFVFQPGTECLIPGYSFLLGAWGERRTGGGEGAEGGGEAKEGEGGGAGKEEEGQAVKSSGRVSLMYHTRASRPCSTGL